MDALTTFQSLTSLDFIPANRIMTVPQVDVAVACLCITVAVFGLTANGIVLVVILSSKDLRSKDYVWFILNRVLSDFVYCILLAVGHPVAILLESTTMCKVVGFIDTSVAMSTILVEPFLACNRYLSILHNTMHKKVYTLRNVYWMCGLIWVVGFGSTVPHIFTGSLGRAIGTVCCVSLTRDSVLVAVLAEYVPVFGCAGSVAVFNYKIYKFLKDHQSQQMTNAQRTKLQSDREMLRFIGISAFLPLILQVPLVVAFWVQMLVPIQEWILFSVTILFTMMFITNPLIALFMVKPLRHRFMEFAGRFRLKSNTVHATDG